MAEIYTTTTSTPDVITSNLATGESVMSLSSASLAPGPGRPLIDGVPIVGPNKIRVGLNIISRSYEDANGIFRDRIIRLKRNIDLIYNYLTEENYRAMSDVINNKLMQGSRFFNVTVFYPGYGAVTSIHYLGTPGKFEALKSTLANGVEVWSTTISLIEVEGIKFPNINQIPV
jgi:hypothetical protein